MIGSRFKPSAVSRMKTLFRFEEQNMNWNLNDYTIQTNAMAYGLKEAKIGPNSKALLWMDDKHSAELATILMGCLKAGVNTISMNQILHSNGSDKLNKNSIEVLAKENPDILIISPNQKLESKKKIEWLYDFLPHLERSNSNKKLQIKEMPNLKHVLQTGYYAKKGTMKFRDFLLYRDRNLSNHEVMDYKQFYENALNEGEDILKDIQPQDHVYFTADFDNYTAIKKIMLGSTLSGYFMNFISKDLIHCSDLKFINDLDDSVRCHIIVDKHSEHVMRERVSRGNVNYINL